MPVPMTQEEIVHVPAVVNNHRHHHVEQKVIVDFHVPHEKEEIVQGPKMIPQERVFSAPGGADCRGPNADGTKKKWSSFPL